MTNKEAQDEAPLMGKMLEEVKTAMAKVFDESVGIDGIRPMYIAARTAGLLAADVMLQVRAQNPESGMKLAEALKEVVIADIEYALAVTNEALAAVEERLDEMEMDEAMGKVGGGTEH